MNQYLVTAFDFTDEQALDRRLATRQKHLDGAAALKENNNFIIAAAILNDEGKMVGSSMLVQFETEEALNAWLEQEPYVKERVWESVDVKPVKVANI